MVHQSLFKHKPNKNFSIPQLYYDKRNDLLDEMEILGFPLSSPFGLLANQDVVKGVKAADIPLHLGKEVTIVGYLVTTKYAKTKRGQTMFFGTFLDEERNWIDTVLFPDVAARFSFKGYGCYLIKGKVTNEFNFYTVEVISLEKLGWWNAGD